jgi:hypothetical protein
MRHRPAITLVEVLIAIFVMGIGMLALLVLFPLGALSIARALQDDRAAQAAANATAWANAVDLRHDLQVMENPAAGSLGPFRDPFGGTPPALVAPYGGPSFPVFIDPYYYRLGSTSIGNFTVAGVPVTPGFARRSLSLSGLVPGRTMPLTAAETTRWFTLLDDITFKSGEPADGTPEVPAGGFVKRGGRYTWAYLLKRPRAYSPEVVDLSVVVYGSRPVQVPGGENSYFAASDTSVPPNPNILNVYWNPASTDKPPFRKGVWVLDTTVDLTPNPASPAQPWQVPRGYFYRVVGTTDLGLDTGTGLNVTQLEIQSPLKAVLPPPNPAKPSPGMGTIVLMEQVVEVFDRGSGWKP